MDTMGWYMRRRSRKRKTPGAFERLKHLNTHNTEGLEELPESLTQSPEKAGKKPLYKTKYFWYPFASILIALAIVFDLNANSFSDSFFFGWLVYDDSNDLQEYYQEHKARMDSIFQFVQERNGKLAGIRYDDQGIILQLRSEDYKALQKDRNPHNWHRNSTDFHSKYEPEIIDGALKVDTYGYHRLYPDFWSYNLKVDRLRDINTTIMAHIETSYAELHAILTILAREHYEVNLNNGQPAISLRFHAQNFEIIRNDSVSSLKQGSEVRFVQKPRFSNLARESHEK